MVLNQLTHLGFGFFVSVIGALPFGLVNLSVLDAANRMNNRVALSISHGAAIVEVLFGLIAIYAGSIIHQFISENSIINYISIAVLGLAGIIFLAKRRNIKSPGQSKSSGFFKGALLNIISFQVLIFWLVAVAFLSSKQIMDYHFTTILVFVIGIWIGKMTVLWLYIQLSNKIVSKSKIMSNNMDRILGFILFVIALIQIVRL
jgi:threonine/homoserine/homoserine lactone efflux protein